MNALDENLSILLERSEQPANHQTLTLLSTPNQSTLDAFHTSTTSTSTPAESNSHSSQPFTSSSSSILPNSSFFSSPSSAALSSSSSSAVSLFPASAYINSIELIIEEEIGSGDFGVVYRGKYRSIEVAIKCIKLPLLSKNNLTEEQMIKQKKIMTARIESLTREAQILHSLPKSDHVIEFLGISIIEGRLAIITSFCEYGNLEQLLIHSHSHHPPHSHSIRRSISPPPLSITHKTLLSFALQAARGISHLHANQVIHQDIAARNYLLNSSLTLQVSDFGLSRVLSPFGTSVSKSDLAAWNWSSPESLLRKEFSTASDCFSFAVSIWELFARRPPFYGILRVRIPPMIVNGEREVIDQSWPVVIQRLLTLCWQQQAQDRPSLVTVIKMLEMALEQDEIDETPLKSPAFPSQTYQPRPPSPTNVPPPPSALAISKLFSPSLNGTNGPNGTHSNTPSFSSAPFSSNPMSIGNSNNSSRASSGLGGSGSGANNTGFVLPPLSSSPGFSYSDVFDQSQLEKLAERQFRLKQSNRTQFSSPDHTKNPLAPSNAATSISFNNQHSMNTYDEPFSPLDLTATGPTKPSPPSFSPLAAFDLLSSTHTPASSSPAATASASPPPLVEVTGTQRPIIDEINILPQQQKAQIKLETPVYSPAGFSERVRTPAAFAALTPLPLSAAPPPSAAPPASASKSVSVSSPLLGAPALAPVPAAPIEPQAVPAGAIPHTHSPRLFFLKPTVPSPAPNTPAPSTSLSFATGPVASSLDSQTPSTSASVVPSSPAQDAFGSPVPASVFRPTSLLSAQLSHLSLTPSAAPSSTPPSAATPIIRHSLKKKSRLPGAHIESATDGREREREKKEEEQEQPSGVPQSFMPESFIATKRSGLISGMIGWLASKMESKSAKSAEGGTQAPTVAGEASSASTAALGLSAAAGRRSGTTPEAVGGGGPRLPSQPPLATMTASFQVASLKQENEAAIEAEPTEAPTLTSSRSEPPLRPGSVAHPAKSAAAPFQETNAASPRITPAQIQAVAASIPSIPYYESRYAIPPITSSVSEPTPIRNEADFMNIKKSQRKSRKEKKKRKEKAAQMHDEEEQEETEEEAEDGEEEEEEVTTETASSSDTDELELEEEILFEATTVPPFLGSAEQEKQLQAEDGADEKREEAAEGEEEESWEPEDEFDDAAAEGRPGDLAAAPLAARSRTQSDASNASTSSGSGVRVSKVAPLSLSSLSNFQRTGEMLVAIYKGHKLRGIQIEEEMLQEVKREIPAHTNILTFDYLIEHLTEEEQETLPSTSLIPPFAFVPQHRIRKHHLLHYLKNTRNLQRYQLIKFALDIALAVQHFHIHLPHHPITPRLRTIFVSADDHIQVPIPSAAHLLHFSRENDEDTAARYSAPESIEYGSLDERSDVWQLGLAFYEIGMRGKELVYERILNDKYQSNTAALLIGIVRGEVNLTCGAALNESMGTDYCSLIEECLSRDSNKRPNIDEIVKRLQSLRKKERRRRGGGDGGTDVQESNNTNSNSNNSSEIGKRARDKHRRDSGHHSNKNRRRHSSGGGNSASGGSGGKGSEKGKGKGSHKRTKMQRFRT